MGKIPPVGSTIRYRPVAVLVAIIVPLIIVWFSLGPLRSALDEAFPVEQVSAADDPGLSQFIAEDGYVKVPYDVVRKELCGVSSQITLRRWHQYPAPLGLRQDVIPLYSANNPISPIGETRLMMWYRVPPGTPGGPWDVESSAMDSCGAPIGVNRPRPTSHREVVLPVTDQKALVTSPMDEK